jgi:hypothetical protein
VRGAGRVGVLLLAPGRVTLGVYALTESGRLRAHVRRTEGIGDPAWPRLRDRLRWLVALARARHAEGVTIVLRASLRGVAWSRRVAGEARRLRCEVLRSTAADERRWLFLGGIREVSAGDGVVAELEPSGIALARFRGRVLAATAAIALGDAPARSGLALGGRGGVLVVSGSLVPDDGARPERQARAALARLLRWTGNHAPVSSRDALAAGIAATLLRAPIPGVKPD